MTNEIGEHMDSGPILRRIEQLDEQRSKHLAAAESNRKEADKIQGAIDELWRWAEGRKDMYGMFVAPGRTRAEFRLPVFGSKEQVQEAIANFRKPEAIRGETEEEARRLRADKSRDIGQNLVDEIGPMGEGSGLNP